MPKPHLASEPVCVVGLTRSVAIRVSGYGVILLFVALGILATWTGNNAWSLAFSPDRSLIQSGLILLIASAGAVVLHEWIHGALFRIFGGRPQFGVGRAWILPYAYATSPGDPFTLTQMTVIALGPLVILSIASLAAIAWAPALATAAAAVFVTNFSGAVGDLWLVRQMWRFRRCDDLYLVDLKDGLAIYTSDSKAQGIVAHMSAGERGAKTRFIAVWLLTSTLFFMATMPVFIVKVESA